MSGRREKEKRRLLKERQAQLLATMNPNQTNPGLQIIQYLENFIELSNALTGEKPTSITLTDVMYNAYVQESQRHAEVLGLKSGFKDDQPVFNGVKLLKKSPIVIDSGNNTPPPAETPPAN